jgi:hypothetical protein
VTDVEALVCTMAASMIGGKFAQARSNLSPQDMIKGSVDVAIMIINEVKSRKKTEPEKPPTDTSVGGA